MNETWIETELAGLKEANLRRRLTARQGPAASTSQQERTDILRLASNAYLGLNTHPHVVACAQKAAHRWGAGAAASPLVSGYTGLHEELEQRLAELKDTEDALVFPSGYHANIGTITALADRGDLILSDARNHASIVDACRLSRADLRIFDHTDAEHLDDLLAAHRGDYRRCLIVTDGVFSMGGDLAPVPAIVSIARAHEAMLMVDDAHGTGVLGETGAGTLEHLQVPAESVDVQMGTLSKALASQGGFVAGSHALCELVRNRARAYIFSTALAPPAAASALAALEILEQEPERRKRLHRNAQRLEDGIAAMGLAARPGPTPILPIVLGTERQALAFSRALEAEGVLVPAIRPPSVPEGTSRLRVTEMATHTDEEIDRALAAFDAAAQSTETEPAGLQP